MRLVYSWIRFVLVGISIFTPNTYTSKDAKLHDQFSHDLKKEKPILHAQGYACWKSLRENARVLSESGARKCQLRFERLDWWRFPGARLFLPWDDMLSVWKCLDLIRHVKNLTARMHYTWVIDQSVSTCRHLSRAFPNNYWSSNHLLTCIYAQPVCALFAMHYL